ncbi:MAG: carbohydrate ABC transporter permease, partial [Candidatus Scatosoma sp.]
MENVNVLKNDQNRLPGAPGVKKERLRKKRAIGVFDILNIIILSLFSIACLYPFVNILFTSFSTEVDYYASTLLVIPRHFTFEAYRYIFLEGGILRAFGNSVFVAVVGVTYCMLLTSFGAYALTKRNLPGKNILFTFILITMFFGGGVIPFFLVLKDLQLYNNLLGLIIPFGINSYNMIVLRNFYSNVPEEVIESAKLDGANDFIILFRLVMPLSLAGIATIALFYFVGKWNEWYWPMLLLQDEELFTLSLELRNILSDLQAADYYNSVGVDSSKLYAKGQDAASIVVAILPILCIYPFV